VLLTVGAICEINFNRFVSRPLQAGGSVIVSFVTETADRGRKTSQEEKTRSERYPKKINLREIKPKSENSEEDLKERYLNEIDPRRSFSGY
jgi:hypothetical protein